MSGDARARRSRRSGTDAVGHDFPLTTGSRLGYDPQQVDDFLRTARAAFDAPAGGAAPGPQDAAPDPAPGSAPRAGSGTLSEVTSSGIRSVAFDLRRRGYSPARVDAALERLEEAFAEREHERRRGELGEDAWSADLRDRAQELLDRLDRGDAARFRREGPFRRGYDVGDVDRFAEMLVRYFRDDDLVTPDEVRSIAFRRRRGGYDEAQVDRVLDAVVDVMLSVE